MEPSGSFKPKGSFGVPPEMMKEMDDARRRAPPTQQSKVPGTNLPQNPPAGAAPQQPAGAAPTDAPAPVTDAAAKQEKDEETQREVYQKTMTSLREDLNCDITVDDVKDYIFKGRLTKEVTIIPGYLTGVFQSINPTEYMEVDKRVAEFRDEAKYTPEGMANQKTIVMLSYVWVAANGKPLSAQNDPSKREVHIRKLAAHTVDMASKAWTKFDDLVLLTLNEKKFVKKS